VMAGEGDGAGDGVDGFDDPRKSAWLLRPISGGREFCRARRGRFSVLEEEILDGAGDIGSGICAGEEGRGFSIGGLGRTRRLSRGAA